MFQFPLVKTIKDERKKVSSKGNKIFIKIKYFDPHTGEELSKNLNTNKIDLLFDIAKREVRIEVLSSFLKSLDCLDGGIDTEMSFKFDPVESIKEYIENSKRTDADKIQFEMPKYDSKTGDYTPEIFTESISQIRGLIKKETAELNEIKAFLEVL